MIHNSPNDFLSLHKNIQYFNTHKEECFLDNNLNIIDKASSGEADNKVSVNEIPGLIFKKIQELYTGTSRDDKWLKLIKNDILQLDSRLSHITSKIGVEIDSWQQKDPKGLQPVDWVKEGILNVVTILDQDIPDDNGAMKYVLYSAIRSPDNLIIIPKTVFTEVSKEMWKQYIAYQNLVLLEQKASGFLVFVPKNLCKGSDLTSSLAHLDLDPDQLTPVTFDDIYKNPKGERPKIEQWERLWSSSSHLKKRWHIAGHGQSENNDGKSTSIVALNIPHFSQLLKAIKKQKTEFVSFESCHIARTIPEKQLEFIPEGEFPVLIWGRNDEPSHSHHPNLSLFWMGIQNYLKNDFKSKKIETSLDEFMNNYNKDLPEFNGKSTSCDYENQPLVLPIHSKNSPVGFKSPQGPHTKNVISIYYNDVRGAQLASQKSIHWKEAKPNEIIIPLKKESVELYPPVVENTLRLKHEKVNFKSMIPGNAHHYIQKVILEKGKSEDFFKSIVQDYSHRRMNNSKGLFIGTLETSEGLLKNTSILMTPKNSRISYFDNTSGKFRVANLSSSGGEMTWEDATKEEMVLSIAQFLVHSFPSSETVHLATGGQSDRMNAFEYVMQELSPIIGDTDPFKKFHFCISALLFNTIDSSFFCELEGLTKNLQSLVIQLLFETQQDIQILKEICRKGWIDENNYKLVQNLTDKDKSELYDLLTEKGVIKESHIREILDVFQKKKYDFSGVPLIESWVRHHKKNISPELLDEIYNLAKEHYKEKVLWNSSPNTLFPPSASLLPLLLSNEVFAGSLDSADAYKCMIKAPRFRLEVDSLFLDSKDFLEKFLGEQEHPEKFLADIIPVIIARGFSEGLQWILSYNREHKLIEETKCLDYIKSGVIQAINNLHCPSQKQLDAIVKLISQLPENTLSLSDRISLMQSAMEKDTTLMICKNLLIESLAAQHPEIRSWVLNKISGEDRVYYCENLSDYIDHLDRLFKLTTEEKCELLDTLLPLAVMKGNIPLIKKLSPWLHLIDEKKRQELLIRAMMAFKNNEAVVEELLALGLDINDYRFVCLLREELLVWCYNVPFRFFLKNMKVALDRISNEDFKNILKDWSFVYDPSVELLEYLFVERGIKVDSGQFDNVMDMMSDSYLIGAARFKVEEEEQLRKFERLAEWFAKHDFNLDNLSNKNKVNFKGLVLRLVSDGCSIELIKKLLALLPLSESSNIYDRILQTAAMRGRADVLQLLLDLGCKYSLNTLQEALFYAAERGDVQTQDSIKKFS